MWIRGWPKSLPGLKALLLLSFHLCPKHLCFLNPNLPHEYIEKLKDDNIRQGTCPKCGHGRLVYWPIGFRDALKANAKYHESIGV